MSGPTKQAQAAQQQHQMMADQGMQAVVASTMRRRTREAGPVARAGREGAKTVARAVGAIGQAVQNGMGDN